MSQDTVDGLLSAVHARVLNRALPVRQHLTIVWRAALLRQILLGVFGAGFMSDGFPV